MGVEFRGVEFRGGEKGRGDGGEALEAGLAEPWSLS